MAKEYKTMTELVNAFADLSIDVLYSAPAGEQRISQVSYSKVNPPPEQFLCSEEECTRVGISMLDELRPFVLQHLQELKQGNPTARKLNEEVLAPCRGRIQCQATECLACSKGFTLLLKGTLK
jgi:hypothetical protein